MSNATPSFNVERFHDGKIVMAVLNRPPLNTTVQTTYSQVIELIAEINNDTRVCSLIIAAEGRVFSAGADKNDFQNATAQESALRRPVLRAACDALLACEVPVVTAVHGPAVGAGALIAASGDVILMAPEAFISIPEIDSGVIGAARGLMKIVPSQKAREMALTGSRVSADQLYGYGAVHSIVPQEQIRDRALEVAERLASHGSLTVRKWKEALNVGAEVSPKAGLLIEQCLSQELAALSAPVEEVAR